MTDKSQLGELLKMAVGALSSLTEDQEKPEPVLENCSRCGIHEADTDWGILYDYRVTVRDGEEGYSEVIQWLCEECSIAVNDVLIELGFVDHRHGSTSTLEDMNCPQAQGVGECPINPEGEYGPHTVLYVEE